jgi:4-methyl-5(b-hydroxyethyl)-thiazole monophosphate biosynthesis
MVSILLTNGFECAEALVTLDLLHRAGIQADLTGLEDAQVASANNVKVQTDRVLREVGQDAFLADLDMVILPGGLDNVLGLRASQAAKDVVTKAAAEGKYIAAICAAPWFLTDIGLTDGKNIVCYPGMEDKMGSANVQVGSKVVVDGKLITGQGPGAAYDFALKLIEVLKGAEMMEQVRNEIHYGNC